MNKLKYSLLIIVAIAYVITAPIVAIRLIYATFATSDEAWKIAKAMDDLLNAATNGTPRQWVSTRAGLAAREGKAWGCVLCKVLDWIQGYPGHCENAIAKDSSVRG